MYNYFQKYAEREVYIADLWLSTIIPEIKIVWNDFDIFYEINRENTSFHDLRVSMILKNKNNIDPNFTIDFTLEIKEEENYWFCQTGNIGLDLLSAFQFTSFEIESYFKQEKNRWISRSEQELFFNNIHIDKKGKLFTCDADIQLFYCSCKRNKKIPVLLKAYINNCLKENREYFLNHFSIRINDKSKYDSKTDTWESAAILVNPYLDLTLNKCEIKRGEKLVNFLSDKFN